MILDITFGCFKETIKQSKSRKMIMVQSIGLIIETIKKLNKYKNH